MDTSVREIEFDTAGVCNFCREYDARAQERVHVSDAEFERLVAAIKARGRGRAYDAVIGLSGGLDSTYLAYVLHKAGLRLLGVHVDNGWNTAEADQNIKALVDRLAIDYELIKVPFDDFRDLQLSFLKASVPNIELPTDNALRATLFLTAARHGASTLVDGQNHVSEGILPVSYGHYNWDAYHLKAIHARFGTRDVSSIPLLGLWRLAYYYLAKGIRVYHPLNYVPYRREDVAKWAQENLGWRPYGAKHHESVITRFFQAYILPRKFGHDKRRAHLSTLVCSGQITRDQALAEIAKPAYASPALEAADHAEFLRKLELTEQEFQNIMSAPPREHSEFPSTGWVWRLAVFLARRGIRPQV
jgi:N-acetyl sugar amidotransferase